MTDFTFGNLLVKVAIFAAMLITLLTAVGISVLANVISDSLKSLIKKK